MKITKRQLRQIVVKAINEGRDTNLAMLYDPRGDGSLDTLTTDQVKFEYGMYTGRKFKDVPYYISIDSEQELGEIQRRGDPYTYTTAGSGKMKVVSGPAKDTRAARKWMGALVQNPEDKTSSDKVQQPTTPQPPESPQDGTRSADIEPTPTPTPTRYRDKKYIATKAQVAALIRAFAEEMNSKSFSNQGVVNTYKQLANDVAAGTKDKDEALYSVWRQASPKVKRQSGIEQ